MASKLLKPVTSARNLNLTSPASDVGGEVWVLSTLQDGR